MALKMSGNLSKAIIAVVALALVGAVVYFVASGSSMRKVSANFDEAIGVYPGTPVKILGVNVGEVTGVTPKGGYVHVEMDYDSKYRLPAKPYALLVANSLVSDRFIQLGDKNGQAYSGVGPSAPNNFTIDKSYTQSPAELDAIYKALSDLSSALGPNGANKNGALSQLLKVAAANLKGNGKDIGSTIHDLSTAVSTLSNNSGNLFGTVKNLQKFTSALKTSDSTLRHFEQQLAQVASDLASERQDFAGALQQLGLALDSVATFVKTNANAAHVDLVGLRKITQILVNEQGSLNEALAIAPVALANVVHAYTPTSGGNSYIGTRSNLAGLTDPSQLCQALGALTQGQLGTLLTKLGIGGLLGTVTSSCSKILGSKTGSSSGSHISLTPSTDAPIGGLITGGGN